jgi:hypothetical protein
MKLLGVMVKNIFQGFYFKHKKTRKVFNLKDQLQRNLGPEPKFEFGKISFGHPVLIISNLFHN